MDRGCSPYLGAHSASSEPGRRKEERLRVAEEAGESPAAPGPRVGVQVALCKASAEELEPRSQVGVFIFRHQPHVLIQHLRK